ncbi:hypothetical protein PMAYCL1PPCAC_10179 [Pristionchus mayeri]|uniref:Uncharacterized protein n=1 Tax=Pristionchus mayeri TaxID=1317129 RepID=A0AAN4ZHH8_9BILA|nr:hypothetical protein PMAYCL1PPCAC_10179 [Pristionchus mayeri]
MVRISIPVRNRKDDVIKYICQAISPVTKAVFIHFLRNIEDLKFISKMLVNTKAKKMSISANSLLHLNESIRKELISTVKQHAVELIYLTFIRGQLDQINPETFMRGLVDCTENGTICSTAEKTSNLFDQPRTFWQGMADKLTQHPRLARYRECKSVISSADFAYDKTFHWLKISLADMPFETS